MLKTGSAYLDNFFNYKKEITTIYGEAGTGKTTLAKLAAIEQSKNNNKIIFVDTENSFSIDRFKQLADNDYRNLLDLIIILKVRNFKQQQLIIKNLKNIINSEISLIIIDTISFYYRRMLKSKSDLANAMLVSQLRILNEISKTIPVLITNQVYADIKNKRIKMLADNIIKKFSNSVIELQKNGKRKLILKNPKKEIFFEIKDKGILGIK